MNFAGSAEILFCGGIITFHDQFVPWFEFGKFSTDQQGGTWADFARHVELFHYRNFVRRPENLTEHRGTTDSPIMGRLLACHMDLGRAIGLGDNAVVAFVGAGGKKTAMSRLVHEVPERSVVYTTSTNMPPPAGLPLVLVGPEQFRRFRNPRSSAIALAYESIDDPSRVPTKVRGFRAEDIDCLVKEAGFSWVLVKADGARRREFTAPASHEPAIPASSTVVVVVVSVAAIGQQVDAGAVHRPERVAALAEIEMEDRLTVKSAARVLAATEGGIKGIPSDARGVLLVNKADSDRLQETGVDLVNATRTRTDRYDRGIVASLRTGDIHCIIGN